MPVLHAIAADTTTTRSFARASSRSASANRCVYVAPLPPPLISPVSRLNGVTP